MSWIFAIIIFGLLVWNVWITDERDYWRDLAEREDADNDRMDRELLRIVNGRVKHETADN